MFKLARIFIVLATVLMMAGIALAQERPLPQHSDPTWQASYWNNTSLSGAPALRRSETNLDHDWGRPDYNWARWYPDLEPGRYEVLVFIPQRYTTTSNARYWVAHADGYALRAVDQSVHGGRWVSLGTYRFDGGAGEYVSLSDVTYESRLSRLIAFDAVKWVPR